MPQKYREGGKLFQVERRGREAQQRPGKKRAGSPVLWDKGRLAEEVGEPPADEAKRLGASGSCPKTPKQEIQEGSYRW